MPLGSHLLGGAEPCLYQVEDRSQVCQAQGSATMVLHTSHQVSLEVSGKGSSPSHSPIVSAGHHWSLGKVIVLHGLANFYTDLAGVFVIVGWREGRSGRVTFLGPGGRLTMVPLWQGCWPLVRLLLAPNLSLFLEPPSFLVLGLVPADLGSFLWRQK